MTNRVGGVGGSITDCDSVGVRSNRTRPSIERAVQKEHDIWNYPLGENYPLEETVQTVVWTDTTSNILWEYWYSCQKYMG